MRKGGLMDCSKNVYRSIKGERAKPVSEMPTKQQINDFWGSLWGIPVQHNNEAPWLEKLRHEYCVTAKQKDYEITDEILDKALTKMANDKPGRDLIAGIWIKNMQSVREMLKGNLQSMLNNCQDLPDWLLTAKTILISKNEETHKPENYRLIAIQNAIYKTYTALVAEFIMNHCESSNIVTEEQAAGKGNSWGCTDQLLINKMIHKEVIQNRRNLTTVWLDYKKAFDSVPHSWIVESLKLAGAPCRQDHKCHNCTNDQMKNQNAYIYIYMERITTLRLMK